MFHVDTKELCQHFTTCPPLQIHPISGDTRIAATVTVLGTMQPVENHQQREVLLGEVRAMLVPRGRPQHPWRRQVIRIRGHHHFPC